MKRQNEQQKLKALVRDLERELSQEKNQMEALEETQERLQQAERICQELADENRRLREESTDWQQRFATGEENQREISVLRQQLNALQAEHARLVNTNHQLQEKLTGQSHSSSVESGAADATPQQRTKTVLGGALTGSGAADDHLIVATDPTPKTDPGKERKATQILWGFVVRNWRFGAIFAGVIFLIMASAVSVKILRTEGSSPTKPTAFPPEAATAEQVTRPDSTPSIAPAPRVRGTYQTVRPSQVYSGPSEDSALITDIGAGVKLNVVDSKGGWLEIRSKHGRPPGFIRQEVAVRIGSN